MSAVPNSSNPWGHEFYKMSGAGNDFVICDLRGSNFQFSKDQIVKISNRKVIGCDQFIIIRGSTEADCQMDIFNADGSVSGACGNATRCVAKIILDEKQNSVKNSQNFVSIKTQAAILKAWAVSGSESILNERLNLDGQKIAVNMGSPKILDSKITLYGFDFCHIDVGNPHAVAIINQPLTDEEFFKIAPKIEIDSAFPNKTNVEFCQIQSNGEIEVRVWERGVGETLACGSGACAVGFFAIKNSLISGNSALVKFKGGSLEIHALQDEIIMTGGYQKIFYGKFDEEFLA